MIENRPLLTIMTHAVLILGVAAVCFPIWMALVSSTHLGARLSQDPLPLWFGSQGEAIEAYMQRVIARRSFQQGLTELEQEMRL